MYIQLTAPSFVFPMRPTARMLATLIEFCSKKVMMSSAAYPVMVLGALCQAVLSLGRESGLPLLIQALASVPSLRARDEQWADFIWSDPGPADADRQSHQEPIAAAQPGMVGSYQDVRHLAGAEVA